MNQLLCFIINELIKLGEFLRDLLAVVLVVGLMLWLIAVTIDGHCVLGGSGLAVLFYLCNRWRLM